MDIGGDKMDFEITDEEKGSLESFSSPAGLKRYDRVGLSVEEKELIQDYFVKKRARILDACCGIGRTTAPLHEMGFDVVGLDISKPMIERARSKFPSIDFRVGDVYKLEFEDETFDYVLISFNGLDTMCPEERRLQALREIHRVLITNGIFIFSAHNPWWVVPVSFVRPSAYRSLLKFWVVSILNKGFFSSYRLVRENYGELWTYYISPPKQIRQLEDCGFQLVEVRGRYKNRLKYFGAFPHYVARK